MEAQYDAFFRANFRLIVKVVMQAGARIDEAEDAAAHASAEVFRHWTQVHDPLAYAIRAALNSFYRSRQRESEGHRRAVAALLLMPGSDHDAMLDAGQEWSRVVAMLSALPAAQYEVMAYTVAGFSPAEMAEILGKSPEAVRANLRHARRRLSKQINNRGGRPSDE